MRRRVDRKPFGRMCAALFETIRQHTICRYLAADKSRHFGQLRNLEVSDAFDEPLPDAELDAWEGNPDP